MAFSRARAFTDIKVRLWESHEQGYRNGKWYTRNVVIENVLKTCAHPTKASSAAGIVQFISNTQLERAVYSPNCISPASSVSFRSPIKASLLVTQVGYLICPHIANIQYIPYTLVYSKRNEPFCFTYVSVFANGKRFIHSVQCLLWTFV